MTLYGIGAQRVVLTKDAIGAAVNLVLNLTLTVAWGLPGAVIANSCAQIVGSAIVWRHIGRRFDVRSLVDPLLRLLVSSAAAAGVARLLVDTVSGLTGVVIALLCAVGVYGVAVVCTGAVRPREWRVFRGRLTLAGQWEVWMMNRSREWGSLRMLGLARKGVQHPLRTTRKILARVWDGLPRSVQSRWSLGKTPQLSFWRRYLETKGLYWPDEYRARLLPDTRLQDEIVACLTEKSAEVHILDVGAGPLTRLGKRWPDHVVHLTAVDPLADEYNRILDECGIVPVVRTQAGEVERLRESFDADQFDLIYMRNALDHSYDPLLGIRQMLSVVKPGGWVYLDHAINEGKNEGYRGMHQWNFTEEKGEYIIWNRRMRVSVDEVVRGEGQLFIERTRQEGEDWLTVRIRKSQSKAVGHETV
jgi:SAM-dependent methyltransferase